MLSKANCSICKYVFADSDFANSYAGMKVDKERSCGCGAPRAIFLVCTYCTGEGEPFLRGSSTEMCTACYFAAVKRHQAQERSHEEARRRSPRARGSDTDLKEMLEKHPLLTSLWVTAMAALVMVYSIPAAFSGGFDRFMPRPLAYLLAGIEIIVLPLVVLSTWRVWFDRNT